jgi:hypothetical protein
MWLVRMYGYYFLCSFLCDVWLWHSWPFVSMNFCFSELLQKYRRLYCIVGCFPTIILRAPWVVDGIHTVTGSTELFGSGVDGTELKRSFSTGVDGSSFICDVKTVRMVVPFFRLQWSGHWDIYWNAKTEQILRHILGWSCFWICSTDGHVPEFSPQLVMWWDVRWWSELSGTNHLQ